MLVPRYWSEARIQEESEKGQVTVRRFGWSDTSTSDAHAMAESRAREALVYLLAGNAVARREPKVPYNGADGVPIREEILEEYGDHVITRNSYGAWCLNTPNVLFADIDFERLSPLIKFSCQLPFSMGLSGLLLGFYLESLPIAIAAFFVMFILTSTFLRFYLQALTRKAGSVEEQARERIVKWMASHPDWLIRLYRTPAGFRVLVMHETFDPNSPEVDAFFEALGTDEVYRRMCQRQHCFRARLTAKHWRMGSESLPQQDPRPGVWPISPERMAERKEWVDRYESAARNFSACQFVEELGKGRIDSDADEVRRIHDRISRATENLPIA